MKPKRAAGVPGAQSIGVPFLEKWGGSLAVQPSMAALNKCLARSNKSRRGAETTKKWNRQ